MRKPRGIVMKKWFLVGAFILLCNMFFSVCLAMEANKDSAIDWKISVKEKLTPEELEAMRWTEVFQNELAQYFFEVKSIQPDSADKDQIHVTVKAIYRDKAVINNLNEYYRKNLEKEDSIACSEMQMIFQLHKRMYAVKNLKLYSSKRVLIVEQTKDVSFVPVPVKTFADTMYEFVRKCVQN